MKDQIDKIAHSTLLGLVSPPSAQLCKELVELAPKGLDKVFLSDDGSTLKINGELVVDNDGPHSPREVTGQKALAKGLHPIEVKYFDHNGGMLQLKVLTADGKELPVNADMFAY